MKCAIQWVDAQGNATPDTNDAVAMVRRAAHYSARLNIGFAATDWYPICSEHAKRLADPGMEYWERKEIDETAR